MVPNSPTRSSGSLRVRRLLVATAAAAIAAAAANSALRLAAVSAFDIPAAFEPLNASAPVAASIVAAAGAGMAFGVLARLIANPIAAFRIVAIAVLVLSFGGIVPLAVADPPQYPGTDATSIGTLSAMHLVAAVTIVWTLTKLADPRR